MTIVYLTWRSIMNRKFSSLLSILSIALSVALFLGVERIRQGARDGFTNTISGADLLVGARSGELQLLLYSIFHLGAPSNNIRWSTYQEIKNSPMVAWTIPISLGDSYKGHRVVATDNNLFTYYRYHGDKQLELLEGKSFEGTYDVVLGYKVAKELGHKLGDGIIINHGMSSAEAMAHQGAPFKVVGILGPSATPWDKAVFIGLTAMEAIHIDWNSQREKASIEDIEIGQITSFLVGARSRIHTLHLQRFINTYTKEPLLAVIPALTLGRLWRTLGDVESILLLIGATILLVGLVGIMVSLYNSLNERRREIAIFRALGASLWQVIVLLLTESFVLVAAGTIGGLLALYGILLMTRPWLEQNYSLFLPLQAPSTFEWTFLLMTVAAGILIGLVPAIKAYRNSLTDGLTLSS